MCKPNRKLYLDGGVPGIWIVKNVQKVTELNKKERAYLNCLEEEYEVLGGGELESVLKI